MINILFRAIILIALLPVGILASAAETQSYKITFMDSDVTIGFDKIKTQDGEAIIANITPMTGNVGNKIFVDRYESEGSASPDIKSIFVNGHAPKKLFVIVDWAADDASLNTGGTIYQVYVYDEKIENKENHLQLVPDADLMKRFGLGFDGTREGKNVSYKFKTAPAIKRQLIDWGYK